MVPWVMALALVPMLSGTPALHDLGTGRSPVTMTEARLQMAVRNNARAVERFMATHPSARARYGGLHTHDGTRRTLVVLMTDDPLQRPYPWEDDLPFPELLVVHTVRHSQDRIEAFQDLIILDVFRLDRRWGRGICSVGRRPSANAVMVGTLDGRPPAGFWRHYDGTIPRSAVLFEDACPIELD